MEGRAEFERQLRQMGIAPEVVGDARIAFPFVVPAGTFAGRELKLGFDVPAEFPRTPPSGPHFTPRLLPVNPGAAAHPQRSHESPFGPGWEYWSRPYAEWGRDGKTLAAYMAYVRHLFVTT